MNEIKTNARWYLILFVYAGLALATGYTAFIYEQFNPGGVIDEDMHLLIEQHDDIKTHVLEALAIESAAFQERKALSVQSFNIVLGALLGFLSASLVTARAKINGTKNKPSTSDETT